MRWLTSTAIPAMQPMQAKEVRAAVQRWCDTLVAASSEPLQAVVLYGGLVKGEFVPGHSDANVAVVLRVAGPEVLDRLAPAVRQGALEFRLAALLLTEPDLRNFAEVFPGKFLDLQRHHQLLWGEDPFIRVSVSRSNLRLRCEQELRNLLLRLRQAYIARGERPESLEATLGHAVSSLLFNLGILVELQSGRRTDTKAAALEAAATLGLPLEPLRQIWALKQGELRLGPAELRRLYGACLEAVGQAAELAGRQGLTGNA
jgi:predicted nucleotidyltransferase